MHIQILVYWKKILFFSLGITAFILAGCSGSNDSESTLGTEIQLLGKVQKGQFLDGTIVATKLEDNGSLDISHRVEGEINEVGEYNLNISWKGLTHLHAQGHYINEYSGENSSDEIVLEAVYNVSTKQKINLNLLTSLEASRIQELLQTDSNYTNTYSQAKTELKDVFALSELVKSSDLDMFEYNSSIASDNINLLLLSATFLKVTEGVEDANSSQLAPSRVGLKGGSVSSISRFVSDFSKNGKIDEVFEDEWEEIIRDDSKSTISKVSETLNIEVEYVAPPTHWSKRVRLSVSAPQYIFDGTQLKKIIYDIAVPLANYTDRSKVYNLSYETQNGTAVAGSDYSAASGNFSFTYLHNSGQIVIDVLSQSSVAKDFTLDFQSHTEGLSITNPTLEVEILQNTISAAANPRLLTLNLETITVDGVQSSIASSSSVVFSGNGESVVSLGITLNAQTVIPAEYFANIYVTASGETPLFLQKVFMPTIGDVSRRIYYQRTDSTIAFDSALKTFLQTAQSEGKSVRLHAEVVVDESSTVRLDSSSLPQFVQVSNTLGDNVTLSTFEYLGAVDSLCNISSSADGFDKQTLYAKVNMYGLFNRSYLSTPLGIAYDDVCVKLDYDAIAQEYALNLEDGYGVLDDDIQVEMYGYSVSFSDTKVSKDTLEVGTISMPLPDGHTLHTRGFFGNISPRGLRSISFTPQSFNADIDLSTAVLTGEFPLQSYLHGKNLPFYLELNKVRLDSSSLSFESLNREYIFSYSNSERNNASRFSQPESGSFVFTLDANGINSSDTLSFAATTIKPQFPKLQSDITAFEIRVKDSKIRTTTLNKNESYLTSYQQNCSQDSCLNEEKQGTLNLLSTQTRLYANGASLSTNSAQNVSLEWGEKNSKAVFSREHDLGVSIYLPGFVIATNEPDEVGAYLYGSVKATSSALYEYSSNTLKAKSGEYLYAGVNVGEILHSHAPSSKTPSMSVIVGDGVKLNITNTQDTKYYVREAGVTGVFNNTDTLISTTIYGYDMNLKSFKFRQISNRVDTHTKIDGDLHIPGLGNFDVAFQSLAIDCSGNFRGGAIDPSQAEILLGTWQMNSTLIEMAFKNSAGDICSSDKQLWLGHFLKVAALKDSIEIGTYWESGGSPDGTVVTASNDNQLDGNSLLDAEESNGGYNVMLKSASFNFVDGSSGKRAWVEADAQVGLPFWGAKDMSLRMTNISPSERDLSVVTKKDELYIGARTKKQTNTQLANDIRANYEQNISREIFNVLDFSLPVYYNARKRTQTPDFIGRPYEKDLIVFKANALIDKITPETTKVSLGASANLVPLKDPQLHIDLSDPDCLKSIDGNLSVFFNVDKPLQNSIGEVFDKSKVLKEFLSQRFQASLEIPFYLALKQTALLDENDPYLRMEKITAKTLDAIPVVLDKFKREFYAEMLDSFDENHELAAESAQRLNVVIEGYYAYLIHLDLSIKGLEAIQDLQDDNSTLNTIHKYVYKYGLGTPEDDCSWENMLKQQVVTADDKNVTLFRVNEYAVTTKGIVDLSRTMDEYDVLGAVENISIFKIDDKLQSVQEKIDDIDFQKIINAYDKSVTWVDDKFCPRFDKALDKIEDINATLQKIDDTKKAVIAALKLHDTQLRSSDFATFMDALDDVNQNSDFEALRDEFIRLYEQDIAAQLDTMSRLSKKLPRITADEYRMLTVYAVMQIDAVQELDAKFQEIMQPQVDKLQSLVLSIFDSYDYILKETLAKVSETLQKALDYSSTKFKKIPLDSAEVDGYAIFGHDEIHRLHMSATFTTAPDANASEEQSSTSEDGSSGSTFSGPALGAANSGGSFGSSQSDSSSSENTKSEKNDLSFSASLDIINEAFDATAGCSSTNEKSNMRVMITTQEISMGLGKKKLEVDYLELGVILGTGEARAPYVKGAFGAISSSEGMEFSKFNLYDMGLAVGIGSDESYVGAKVSATFDSIQLGMSFLVGNVCNEKVIEILVPPRIKEFITIPENRFNGYMLYGEGQMPFIANGLATIGLRAQLGIWSIDGPPEVLGGLIGGGVFGNIKVINIVGNLVALREYSDGEVRYAGDGWIAGGYGLKCDPDSWSSIEDSRANEGCKTVDATFKHNRDETGWRVTNVETRPKIPFLSYDEK